MCHVTLFSASNSIWHDDDKTDFDKYTFGWRKLQKMKFWLQPSDDGGGDRCQPLRRCLVVIAATGDRADRIAWGKCNIIRQSFGDSNEQTQTINEIESILVKGATPIHTLWIEVLAFTW